MSEKELLEKARRLYKLKKDKEKLDAEEKTLREDITAYMGPREELTVGRFRIRWKTVTSSRLDSGALKKALPEVFAAFLRESVSRRFSIE